MPKSLSSTQQQRIEVHLESGLHPKAISKVGNVGARTVGRYKANLKTWGSITTRMMKSRGRPTTIHLAAQAGLLAYLKAKRGHIEMRRAYIYLMIGASYQLSLQSHEL